MNSVCKDDTKLFCPDCGHPSLARVPVFINKGGVVRIGDAPASRSLRREKKEGCIFGDVGSESLGLENSTKRSTNYLVLDEMEDEV